MNHECKLKTPDSFSDPQPRYIAYNAHMSIGVAISMIFADASRNDCTFLMKHGSLNRWEAWRTKHADILQKGQPVNDLVNNKYGGDPSRVSDEELNSIIEISQ